MLDQLRWRGIAQQVECASCQCQRRPLAKEIHFVYWILCATRLQKPMRERKLGAAILQVWGQLRELSMKAHSRTGARATTNRTWPFLWVRLVSIGGIGACLHEPVCVFEHQFQPRGVAPARQPVQQ